MPIREENRHRYPADWKAISMRIREEAGQKCEQCRAPNGEIVARGAGTHDGTYMLMGGEVFDAETGEYLGMALGSEYNYGRMVKIVLTVAHLDHQPENCDRSNLRALCQRCHNAYDAPARRAGIKSRAREKMAVSDLFAGKPAHP